MEKTFPLEQRELAALKQMEDERTQVLAMIGALSLDMEQAKKNLEASAGNQRSLLRSMLIARGVDQFDRARVENGVLRADVPDSSAAAELPVPERTNGVAALKE